MNYQKNITLNEKSIEIRWTDDELETIKRFVEYVQELEKMIKRNEGAFSPLNMNIKFKNNELKYIINLPNKDSIGILLHKLRPIILQNEKTYLNKILNLLSREINEQLFRKYIQKQKNIFNTVKTTLPFIVKADEEIINSEEIFKMWLNAYEYHRDEEKIKKIKELTVLLPFDAFEFIMIDNLLHNKTKVIFCVFRIIQLVLDSKNLDLNKIYRQCE